MFTLRSFFAFAVLAAAAFAFGPPDAAAQGAKIVIIDQQRVMRDSAAGKDIVSKLQSIESQMVQELQPEQTALATEGQALEQAGQGKTREQLAADPALMSRVQAFAQKSQAFNQKRQVRAQELQLSERKAWATMFQSLEPVLQEVVNETGADVLLDRSAIVYGSDALDRTADVIAKLDARLPTVAVTRERLPQQQAQAQPQQ